MPEPLFESFSQNGEDVVLWRALHWVRAGRYIDVGANHPERDSVSMAFYRHGWRGITVEPDPEFALLQRDERPGDILVEAAITTKDEDRRILHVVDGTGLSTLYGDVARAHARSGYATHDVEVLTRTLDSVLDEVGWQGQDIHFMSLDTEGSEREVLESIDLRMWRPWILVIEATKPNSTESTRQEWEDLVVGAGYRFCLFDGLSCFYVCEERAEVLGAALSYPACILDDYTTREHRELLERAQSTGDLVEQVVRWRSEALTRWSAAVASQAERERTAAEVDQLRREVHALRLEREEIRRSSSWRVTKPLRQLGAMARRAGRHR
jgi:FkbM family methyltransferase